MELKDISILNLMPSNLAKDLGVRMMAEAFDKVLRDTIGKIPDVAIIPNLVLDKIVNETLIDLLAWQFHVDFYDPEFTIEVKRNLVLKSLDWHFRKGTPSVVEDIVSTVFSKAIVQEWFEYGGLPYRFRIAIEEQISDSEAINEFMHAIRSVKNTRSLFDSFTQLLDFIDEVIVKEISEIKGKIGLFDTFNYEVIKYNGYAKYDGSHKYGRGIGDKFAININIGNYSDVFATPLKYKGMIKADGSHKYNGETRAGDSFAAGMRHAIKYNGKYKADGTVKYNSGILVLIL
jgi:phage tail P2-like protein